MNDAASSITGYASTVPTTPSSRPTDIETVCSSEPEELEQAEEMLRMASEDAIGIRASPIEPPLPLLLPPGTPPGPMHGTPGPCIPSWFYQRHPNLPSILVPVDGMVNFGGTMVPLAAPAPMLPQPMPAPSTLKMTSAPARAPPSASRHALSILQPRAHAESCLRPSIQGPAQQTPTIDEGPSCTSPISIRTCEAGTIPSNRHIPPNGSQSSTDSITRPKNRGHIKIDPTTFTSQASTHTTTQPSEASTHDTTTTQTSQAAAHTTAQPSQASTHTTTQTSQATINTTTHTSQASINTTSQADINTGNRVEVQAGLGRQSMEFR